MSEAHDRPVMLVTGGTGGVGAEIAAQAMDNGWTVAVHGLRPDRAKAAVEALKIRYPGGQAIPVAADFRDTAAITGMVESVHARVGRLDAVVDCAVTSPAGVTGPFAKMNPHVFAEHAATALAPMQALCHACLPYLAQSQGSMVVIASDAGRFAAPNQSIIGASRAGAIGFVRNVGMEIAREGVRINCISLTYVANTPLFERFASGGRGEKAQARAGLGLPTPEDVASLALFLSGPGSARITGQVVSINGGLNA